MVDIDDESLSSIKKKRPSLIYDKYNIFEENDDEEEKNSRRNSFMSKNIQSPPSETNKSKKSNSMNIEMNSAQITEHYGTCIKLATENKINKKNAFKLHLIDYLQVNLKGLESFQIASSGLDAGSKIYASRVDNVHQNTYQVLTGLGNPESAGKLNESDENIEVLKDDDNKLKKTARRRFNANKNLFATDIRKIRLPRSHFKAVVDPLFQIQAEKFDDCGVDKLRLNNLYFCDRTEEMVFDCESVLFDDAYDDSELKKIATEYLDITKCSSDLSPLLKPLKICSKFGDFIFTGFPINTTENLTTEDSIPDLANAADSDDDVQPMEVDCIIIDESPVDMDQAMSSPPPTGGVEDDEDVMILETSRNTAEDNSSIFMSGLKTHVNSLVENYGETAHDFLGMWAGPDHWMMKAANIKLMCKTTNKSARTKTDNRSMQSRITDEPLWPELVKTHLSASGRGTVLLAQLPDMSSQFIKSDDTGQLTQLTEHCLNRNLRREFVLPMIGSHFGPDWLSPIGQMMNRDVSLMNKALHPTGVLGEDQDDCTIVKKETMLADELGNVRPLLSQSDDGDDDDNDGGALMHDLDTYMATSISQLHAESSSQHPGMDVEPAPVNNEEDLDHLLTANVRKVQQLNIGYAKTAKRIDVRRLKNEIFQHLRTNVKATIMPPKVGCQSDAGNESQLPMVTKQTSMSSLLNTVDHRSSKETAADLSVPIVLTCLLHLANETGLDLVEDANMGDVSIGQGYSPYDVQMMRQYGVVNFQPSSDIPKRTFKEETVELKTSPIPRKRPRLTGRLSQFNDYYDPDDYCNIK